MPDNPTQADHLGVDTSSLPPALAAALEALGRGLADNTAMMKTMGDEVKGMKTLMVGEGDPDKPGYAARIKALEKSVADLAAQIKVIGGVLFLPVGGLVTMAMQHLFGSGSAPGQ